MVGGGGGSVAVGDFVGGPDRGPPPIVEVDCGEVALDALAVVGTAVAADAEMTTGEALCADAVSGDDDEAGSAGVAEGRAPASSARMGSWPGLDGADAPVTVAAGFAIAAACERDVR